MSITEKKIEIKKKRNEKEFSVTRRIKGIKGEFG